MPALPAGLAGMGVAAAGLKSIHTLRRMQSGTPPAASTSTATPIAAAGGGASAVDTASREPDLPSDAAELPSSPAVVEAPALPERPAVELPTEFQKEAPLPLKPKASNTGLHKDAQIVRKPIVTVEPPSAETDEQSKASEVQSPIPSTLRVGPVPPEASEKKTESSEEPSTTTTAADEYLGLLNQVAKGDLTPEALKELLHSKGLLQI